MQSTCKTWTAFALRQTELFQLVANKEEISNQTYPTRKEDKQRNKDLNPHFGGGFLGEDFVNRINGENHSHPINNRCNHNLLSFS